MFFHRENFISVLNDDQAHLVAKIANQIIDQQGVVVFGAKFTNGECRDFTTSQKATDSHVGILIGLSEMGSLNPSDSPIMLDRPTEKDFVRALQERNKLLEHENRQLRK